MKIALWKLGSLEHKILPSKQSIQKFKSVLAENAENPINDIVHIVWGDDISLTYVDAETNVVVENSGETPRLLIDEKNKDTVVAQILKLPVGTPVEIVRC